MSKYITKTPVRVPMVLPPSMVASINDTIDELSSVGDAGINNNTGSCSDDEIKYRKTYYHKLSKEEAIPASLVTFDLPIAMDSVTFAAFFEKRPQVKASSHSVSEYYKNQSTNKNQIKPKSIIV